MRRVSLILLALVLAIVTVAVPSKHAARAGQPDAAALLILAASTPGEAAPKDAIPAKRCRSAASLLGCPFDLSPPLAIPRRGVVAAAEFDAGSAVLSGRTVPMDLPPPRRLSA